MSYKKVFSTSRFQTKSQNNFKLEGRAKKLFIGSRGAPHPRYAYIGKVYEQGKTSNLLDYEVHCDISFPHVIGIFGSRGSGKSFDLGVFLEEIFLPRPEEGHSDSGIVFDIQDQFWTLEYEPKGSLRSDKAQLHDLAVWGLPSNGIPSLSVFYPQHSDTAVPNAQSFSISPAQLSSADWLAILELERFSAMGQALLVLLEAIGDATPDEMANAIAATPTLTSFQQGTLDGLRWRLQSLAEAKIIGEQGVSIDELLKPGRLSVILMRNLSEGVRGLVVGVIARLTADRMGRIQQERKVAMRTGSKSDLGSGLAGRVWMVLDEAHVLVPSVGATAATAPLIDYVKRGRDAGLSLIFATQQPSAVDARLMSQVDLTITHTLGFESDISAAIARMPTRTAVEYDIDNERASTLAELVRSTGPGEAIIADGSSPRVFVARVRPRVTAHGGATPQS